jgi:hypothetical protein
MVELRSTEERKSTIDECALLPIVAGAAHG